MIRADSWLGRTLGVGARRPQTIREMYPDHPGLWVLDDPEFPRPMAPVIAESFLGDPDLGNAAAEWLATCRTKQEDPEEGNR